MTPTCGPRNCGPLACRTALKRASSGSLSRYPSNPSCRIKVERTRADQLLPSTEQWGFPLGGVEDCCSSPSLLATGIDKTIRGYHVREQLFISFQDTLVYFDCIDVCKVRQGWSEVRLPGLLPPCASADHVLAVLVTVIEPTELDLSLFQEGSRHTDKSQRSPVDLCVALYRTGSVAAPQIGQLVVHSRRQLRGFVSTNAFLEPGYYLILCLAFNHWDLNPAGDGSVTHYPPCVLALHSSKRLLVEHITPSPFVLADGLISLTMAKGQRYEGREGMTAYYLTQGWVNSRPHSSLVFLLTKLSRFF